MKFFGKRMRKNRHGWHYSLRKLDLLVTVSRIPSGGDGEDQWTYACTMGLASFSNGRWFDTAPAAVQALEEQLLAHRAALGKLVPKSSLRIKFH